MKSLNFAICCLATCSVIGGSAARAEAQGSATGSLEFQAHVTPSGGRPEPAREMTFFLLRKNVADIRKDVERADPPLDMDRFIDGLEVSSELKAWLKKNRTVELSGLDFTKRLKTDDILGIPEFLEGYKNLNGAMLNASLPASKANENDRLKNPEKYNRAKEQYMQALRRYIEANPQSVEGLDSQLGEANPSRQWTRVQSDQMRRTEQRVLVLAQTEYLAGKTTSDLNGRGEIHRIATGTYWMTTLDVPAMSGEARLQWDFPVTIRAGETTRIELSNLNALPQPNHMAH